MKTSNFETQIFNTIVKFWKPKKSINGSLLNYTYYQKFENAAREHSLLVVQLICNLSLLFLHLNVHPIQVLMGFDTAVDQLKFRTVICIVWLCL